MKVPGPADLVTALQTQADALAQLPGTVLALNRAVRDLVAAVAQARETFATLNRLATRADALLDDLEQPVAELLPGLRRAAVVLNDPVIDEIPETLRRVQSDVLPVVRQMRETQDRIAGIASVTERLTGFPTASGLLFGRRPGRSAEGYGETKGYGDPKGYGDAADPARREGHRDRRPDGDAGS